MDARDVIIAPIVSEKSYALEAGGVYTLEVHPDANKIQIRQAVEQIFGVHVVKVNTLNRQGKRKRNRRSWTMGKRAATKRALVTLADGETLPIYGS